jgi:diaminohydroxyphosphoribosylaminopyrimidine deaminase/5-amino-6-(5-phosphoribosylamino)uracil reductase
MEDPNPLVAGQGFAFLRAHDVAVSTGAGEADARRLNGPFLTWITRRRPFVVLKAAMSADGFAGRSDARVQLTGASADRHFHRQRAEVGAIGAGSNTVLIDDPLLTSRLVYRERPLTRVVFDWRLRVPPSARVFSTRSSGPVIMVVLRREAESRPRDVEGLRAAGTEFEILDSRDLAEVLRRLADREVQSLLVEGGPTLQAAFLDAKLVDRVQFVRTPVRLGSGVPTFGWPGDRAASGPLRETMLGEDVLTECDVHRLD